MAKKKTSPDTPSTAKAAPARRRAPAKKKPEAAPPIDIAIVAGTEPRAASTARTEPRVASTAGTGASMAGTGSRGNGKTQPSHDEIAEAAYFRHLERGSRHGDEFNDWVEAERELRQRRER